MQHRAHQDSKDPKDDITCQACHAQWTFNDFGTHFLRSDTDDFDTWSNLSIQGNFELENIIEHNSVFENTELPAQMTDKITGEQQTGLWHKGYTMRRWESVILGRGDDGKITTVRPILDYSLSWIDEEETVRFDSVPSQAPNMGFRPYAAHTIGPAGLFYQERLEQFLAKERSAASN
jgi:hypothetical protein